jgi:predicted MFS family arabinose efflux permease
MNQGFRRAAVGIPGFCAFLNLYGPQSLLPLLAQEFAATPADISLTMTATALAIAISAPFAGAIADVLGRKRVIAAAMLLLAIPTAMIAFAPSLSALVFWRFAQGLVLPPIFTVVVAYIGEEWPPAQATGVTALYMAATSFGGFSGRFFAGLLADTIGWRNGFITFAAVTLVCGVVVAAILPRERNFVRSEGLAASGRSMLQHVRNPTLLATYAVGFGTLFNFVALFTYVNFVLAAPPFSLPPTLLGAIFATYLAGSLVLLWLGRAIARYGRRPFIICVLAVWACGAALTLVPSLWTIIGGLTVAAACGFLTQATSTAFVAVTAQSGRTSAIGLYATSFYVGGGFGATLPGLTWDAGGWPACVAMVIAMQIVMATVVALTWKR